MSELLFWAIDSINDAIGMKFQRIGSAISSCSVTSSVSLESRIVTSLVMALIIGKYAYRSRDWPLP